MLVVDQDGEPLPGVLVRVTAPDGAKREVLTNDEGRIDITNIPEGSATVELSAYDAGSFRR